MLIGALIGGLFHSLFAANMQVGANSETLHIIGGTVPYVLHPEQTGPHNPIFSDVIPEASHDPIKQSLLPYARALRDFQAREFDCLYATTTNPVYFDQKLVADGKIIFSKPVNTIKLRAFTRAGEPLIHSWQHLHDKTIVGTKNQLRGIRQQLPEGAARFITVFNAEKAFELLEKARADVAAIYGMDAFLTAPNSIAASDDHIRGYEPRFMYDESFAPVEWGEVMVCWSSPAAKRLIAAFDEHIRALRETGALNNLFDRFSR